MAERGYAPITTTSLWKATSLSAGNAATSDPVDLRIIAKNGMFSLFSSVVAGTAGTVGTTAFTYVGCATRDGNYISPSAAVAIGTRGTGSTSNLNSFEPELMPFMKIIATQTGSGTAGRDSKITADLITQ